MLVANTPYQYQCQICGCWEWGQRHTCAGAAPLGNLPRREEHYLGVTPDQVRQIIREELRLALGKSEVQK